MKSARKQNEQLLRTAGERLSIASSETERIPPLHYTNGLTV
jgi:hypothetical protein